MAKFIIVMLALLLPCTSYGMERGGGADHERLEGGDRVILASTTPEAGLSRALGVSHAEIADPGEQGDDAEDSLDLKLPEEELPDSDIPLTLNNKVEYFIRYFQNAGHASFAKWLSRSERYIPMMRTVLKKEGLPEDLVYLAMIESGFSPRALSVASAVGAWQFMSGTGKRYALRIDSWIDERRDPLKSTVAAARYLKELYGLFNKDWYLAAAGYNAGENKILRAINMYNSRDFWELSKGQYLKRETKDYVPRLVAAAIIAKEPAKYGFGDVAYLPPIDFDVVKVPTQTDLQVIAKACGVSTQTIHDLNPELRRFATPPDYPGYEIKVPKGTAQQFQAEYAKISEGERYTERVQVTHVRYRAKRHDTLVTIAKRFNTTPQTIAELNGLKKSHKLHGKVLTIPVQVAMAAEPAAKPVASEPQAAQPKAEPSVEPSVVNKYYTVRKGDTLFSLARRFNVTARILSAWNNLKARVALRPGKRLIVSKNPVKQEG